MSLILNELKIANKLTLNSSANLGIGKSTTNAPLDVNGNAIISGSLVTTGNVGIGVSPSYRLDVQSGENNSTPILRLRTSDGLGYTFTRNSSNGFLELDGNQVGNIGYIFKSGNLGIGASSPTAATLQVHNSSGNTVAVYKSGGGAAIIMGDTSGPTNYALLESISGGGLRVYTGNGTQTEKLRIQGDGNVGIGATSPSYKLQVNGDVWFANSTGNFGGNFVYVGDSNWGFQTITSDGLIGDALRIRFYDVGSRGFGFYDTSGGGYRMVIKTGNVGIGTVNPRNRLEVSGSMRTGDIYLNSVGGASNPKMFFSSSVGSSSINLEVLQDGTVAFMGKSGSLLDIVDNFQGSLMSVNDVSGFPILEVFSDDKVVMGRYNSNALVVTGSSVGIGTSTPSAKLEVSGSSGDGTPTFRVTSTGAANSFNWAGSIMNATLGSSRNYILLIGQAESTKNSGYIGFNHSGTGGSNSNFLTFGMYGNDNLLNIKGDGNVGIGTTNPANTLHVVGNARISNNIAINSQNDSENLNGALTFWDVPGTTTSMTLFKKSNLIFGRANTLIGNAEYATYHLMDSTNRGWVWRYISSNGTSTGTNVASIRNDTGQMSLGTSYDWSGGYHAQLNISAGQGSATTYRDIDMHGNWNAGEGHAITATYSTGASNIVGQIVFQHDNPGSRIKFGKLYHSGDQSGYPLELISTGANVANLVLNNGNLGLGNASPSYKIDLATSNGTTDQTMLRFGPYNGPGDGQGGGVVWIPNYTGYTKRSAGILQIGEANYFRSGIAFYTNGTADQTTDWSERMRISSLGNVGIGAPTPDAKLQISASSKAMLVGTKSTMTPLYGSFLTGQSNIPLEISSNATSGNGGSWLVLSNEQAGSGVATGLIAFSTSGGGALNSEKRSAVISSQLTADSSNYVTGDLIFFTNNGGFLSEKMRILANGNIGIGTTNANGTLDVVGNIVGDNEYSFRSDQYAINDWDYSGLTTNPTLNSTDDGSWYIDSGASNDWGRGLLSKRRFRRVENLTFEYDAYLQTNDAGAVHCMVGFVGGSSTTYSYGQTPANLIYHDNTALSVYDNGGGQGSDYSFDSRGAWWKFKIVLKGAGATYYVHRNGKWNIIKSTSNNYSNYEYLRIHLTLYRQRIYIRDAKVYVSKNHRRDGDYLHNTYANYLYAMGSVGIGTIIPSSSLHIVASTATNVGSLPSGASSIIDSNTNNYLLFRNSSDNGTYSGLLFQDNNVGGYIVFRNYVGSGANDGTNGDALYYGTYTDHIFQAGSSETVNGRSEVFRIKSSGKTVFYSGVWHNSSDGYERFHFGSSDTTYFKAPNSTFVFRNSSDTAMVILNTTGINIGSANPSAKLEVTLANDTTTGEPSAWGDKFAVFGTGGSTTAGGVFISYDQDNNRGYIGALSPSSAWRNLILQPNANNGNVGIGTKTPGYKLEVNGSFAATTKSFVIKHPTKEGKRLQHGVLEGPSHDVFIKGKSKSNKIILPEYWSKLVDVETIVVQLTPIGKHQKLYVEDVNIDEITIGCGMLESPNYYYTIIAERIDVPKLEVEV